MATTSYGPLLTATFSQRRYPDAITDLEDIARSAKVSVAGFDGCLDDVPGDTFFGANYRGNFMSRALSAAFTVHDRFLHADAFVIYLTPADLDVPVLTPAPP